MSVCSCCRRDAKVGVRERKLACQGGLLASSCASSPTQLTHITLGPRAPPTPLLWAGTAQLGTQLAHHTSSSAPPTPASDSTRPGISRQLPGKAAETCSKITRPLPREQSSSAGPLQKSVRNGERPSAPRAQLWSPAQPCSVQH